MPPYAQHVVVNTGRKDWGSRIEEEEESVEGSGVNFARRLKGLVGRGGDYFNVCMYCWLFMVMFAGDGDDSMEGRANAGTI